MIAVPERYKVLHKIGEGTFAVVFRARDLQTGHEVALKILREPHREDAEIVERFRREAIALSAIRSPHVVAFAASGDTLPFLAMEYAAGPSLREMMCGQAWSLDLAHAAIGQIAQAIDAIHTAGVIHRDLKPDNIVLVAGRGGRVLKLVDFGLAKLPVIEAELALPALTVVGRSFGTPPYMPPEDMHGAPASHAADLWGLAVIAYELIAGMRPWPGDDPRELYFALRHDAIPRVPNVDAAVANRLEAFFASALACDPQRRPSDAATTFARFEQALYGGPIATHDVFAGVVELELDIPPPPTASAIGDETLPGASR